MVELVLSGVFLVSIATFMVAGVRLSRLIRQSRMYRTDLRPDQSVGHGRSPFWQINVFDSRNYGTPEGKRFHRMLLHTTYVQWIGATLAVFSLVWLSQFQ